MDILQVCERFPPAIGGVERYVLELSDRLSTRHKLEVLTTDIQRMTFDSLVRTPNNGDMPGKYMVQRLVVRPPGLPYMRSYGALPGLLGTIGRRRPPDVANVHSFMLLFSDVAAIAETLRGIPTILTVHGFGEENLGIPSKIFSFLHRNSIGRVILRKVQQLIVLGDEAKSSFVALGVPEQKVVVIPNGVDTSKFRPPSAPRSCTQGGPQGPVLLCVAGLSESKGIHYLIRGLPEILRQFPKAALVVAGPDLGFEGQLRALVSRLGVDHAVRLMNNVSYDGVRELYREADLFVLPSLREGLPTVVLEAMASGCPVVGTAVGGTPSLIENGINGIIVPPANTPELVDSIIAVLSDGQLRCRLSEEGVQTASSHDWSIVAQRVEETYQQVLDRMESS